MSTQLGKQKGQNVPTFHSGHFASPRCFHHTSKDAKIFHFSLSNNNVLSHISTSFPYRPISHTHHVDVLQTIG
jgi:hypothetical protein